jgi:hypothetical protein
MRCLTISRPDYEREHSASPRCPLRGRVQRQNDLATFLEYLKFCRLNAAYHACMANQLRIFDWIDERRIEMLAEGRPHWVPSERDFEQAMRDCWDDLVKGTWAESGPTIH